ncbi:hypothetical protein [Sinorhizobium alkalisoli]|uniref:Uncharacterized protein n=1 Tax=Sinorhizobium alkalisoli TaxID=1752398 RepID=A0A1E3V7E3_9HYPH|nr:hypothetical protein [Sinorhizobium alkalisoli]MCG5478988.1 hypothetical protein [Sinorhizobium alkalisoli]ODR89562.1 hypothetical protein A8M32_19760 [Sinorhizobium alkalisoli]
MDTIAVAITDIDRAVGVAGIVLLLLATLPPVLFLRSSRALQLGAMAVLIGAVTFILLKVDGLTAALVVTVADMLLFSAAIISARKRLAQLEAQLQEAMSLIRNLEIIEERRQTFGARNLIGPTSPLAFEATSSKQKK